MTMVGTRIIGKFSYTCPTEACFAPQFRSLSWFASRHESCRLLNTPLWRYCLGSQNGPALANGPLQALIAYGFVMPFQSHSVFARRASYDPSRLPAPDRRQDQTDRVIGEARKPCSSGRCDSWRHDSVECFSIVDHFRSRSWDCRTARVRVPAGGYRPNGRQLSSRRSRCKCHRGAIRHTNDRR